MAEKPTSSSTMYTTFAAPSGALGGSNGDQSGTESRMSMLIVPLNGSLTCRPSLNLLTCVYSSWRVIPAQRAPGGRAASLNSGAEQLRLGGGELVVGQRALLVQGIELSQLVEQ